MLRTISAIMLLISIPLTTQARPLICPFTDTFTIKAPEHVKILSHSEQGNISYAQQQDAQFTLGCGAGGTTGSSGELTIQLGDDKNQCTLQIEDGPMNRNPIMHSVLCTDPTQLRYVNMEHTFGSYSYAIVLKD